MPQAPSRGLLADGGDDQIIVQRDPFLWQEERQGSLRKVENQILEVLVVVDAPPARGWRRAVVHDESPDPGGSSDLGISSVCKGAGECACHAAPIWPRPDGQAAAMYPRQRFYWITVALADGDMGMVEAIWSLLRPRYCSRNTSSSVPAVSRASAQ